jgi:DNA-binding MarR family transcriptional regulator
LLRDLPRWQTIWEHPDQQSKYLKPEFVRERGKRFRVHISYLPEIRKLRQRCAAPTAQQLDEILRVATHGRRATKTSASMVRIFPN